MEELTKDQYNLLKLLDEMKDDSYTKPYTAYNEKNSGEQLYLININFIQKKYTYSTHDLNSLIRRGFVYFVSNDTKYSSKVPNIYNGENYSFIYVTPNGVDYLTIHDDKNSLPSKLKNNIMNGILVTILSTIIMILLGIKN